MIVWKDCLYFAGISPKKHERIKKALDKRRPVHNVFLITAPSNSENCLEFFSANTLLQPHYKNRDVVVYGVAKNADLAEELAATMVCSTYAATETFDVIGYLERRTKGAETG